MMPPELHLAVWAIVAVVLYGLLSRGLFLATDGIRQSLVDLGGQLIDDQRLPEREKDIIRASLEDVHSSRIAWLMALTALRLLVTAPFGSKPKKDACANVPAMLQNSVEWFNLKWMIATVTNSLLATVFFILFMLLLVAMRIPVRVFTHMVARTFHHGTNNSAANPA